MFRVTSKIQAYFACPDVDLNASQRKGAQLQPSLACTHVGDNVERHLVVQPDIPDVFYIVHVGAGTMLFNVEGPTKTRGVITNVRLPRGNIVSESTLHQLLLICAGLHF